MSDDRSTAEASTSSASELKQRKQYVLGQSITDRFKYEPIQQATLEEMAVQDVVYNNCLFRSLLSGAAGGAMGIAFGIFMGAMDPAALNSPAPLAAEPQQKTAMQVLRETYRTTKMRSMCVMSSSLFLVIHFSCLCCDLSVLGCSFVLPTSHTISVEGFRNCQNLKAFHRRQKIFASVEHG
jgi:hypothetical protein